jgi:CheY-like chemotaxis protein
MARILITDDDEGMRSLMATVLRNAGHEIVEARGAREAVERHRENAADVIVTDLLMKDMDGTELLRRIRAFSPNTPIIAISGSRFGKIYLNMARLLGAERILAKPFASETLVQAVDQVLASASPAAKSA